MKRRLLQYVRCPACRSILELPGPIVESNGEVMQGALACRPCGQRYAIDEGIPRLGPSSEPSDAATSRTARSFGYLWSRSEIGREPYGAREYHFDRMAAALRLEAPHGLILDAGCGDGIDLANQAARPDVEVVGVDISTGGTRTSFERTVSLQNAHVVQADLGRLPFDAHQFDLSYSYGVLHHLSSPEAGLAEIVRVVKRGGRVVVYLYEDFAERSFFWRWLLALGNWPRFVTTRLPHALLFRLCQIASPIVYLAFTLPSKAASAVGLTRIGASFPFRHGTHPFGLSGDLYDRFSAPIERRYSRRGAVEFLRSAGLGQIVVAFERGWMVSGVKS